jgi:hypothetical protein
MLERIYVYEAPRCVPSRWVVFAIVLMLWTTHSSAQVQPVTGLYVRAEVPGASSTPTFVRDGGTVEVPMGVSRLRLEVPTGITDAGSLVFALDGEVVATVDAVSDGVLEVPVASGEDDAEEFVTPSSADPERWPASWTYVTSSDLEFGYDPSHGDQVVAVRFQDLAVPAGVRIVRAEAAFTADGTSDGPLTLTVSAERSSDPTVFVEDPDGQSSGGLSRRPRTQATVAWVPEDPWRSGARYVTPNLSEIVQEVIGLADWERGGALVLLFDAAQRTTNYRRAFAFEGSDGDSDRIPRLLLEFEVDPATVRPVVITIDVPLHSTVLTVTPYALQGAGGEMGAPLIITLERPGAAASPEPAPETEVAPRPGPAVAPAAEATLPPPTVPPVTPAPLPPPAAGSVVERIRVGAPGTGIVVGHVELTALEDWTTAIALSWQRVRTTPLWAWVAAGTCAAPGEVLIELHPLDVADTVSATRLPVSRAVLRLGGFVVVVRDRAGAVVGCADLRR